jgi:signal recognition particle receptor subunit beta
MKKTVKVFKILITGSFGSGKTTLVKTLSEIEPVLTEKKISKPDRVKGNKNKTTVAMDMGKLKIGDNLEIHLYASPGQERFDFMIDILKRGILGAIVLVDAENPDSLVEAEKFAKKLKENFDIPVVFGVTKLDSPEAGNFEEIKAKLSDIEGSVVQSIDPRDKESGKKALLKLLELMLQA